MKVRNRQLQAGESTYLTQYYQGNGRGLSTRKLLPSNWRIVQVEVVIRDDNLISLLIRPTALEEEDATRTIQPSGTSGRDTQGAG